MRLRFAHSATGRFDFSFGIMKTLTPKELYFSDYCLRIIIQVYVHWKLKLQKSRYYIYIYDAVLNDNSQKFYLFYTKQWQLYFLIWFWDIGMILLRSYFNCLEEEFLHARSIYEGKLSNLRCIIFHSKTTFVFLKKSSLNAI